MPLPESPDRAGVAAVVEHDSPTVVVVGLGNPYRGDDSIGLEIVREVGQRDDRVQAVQGCADGTELLELWSGASLCVVVDCAVGGGTPGTVHYFDGLADRIPERMFSSFSTHAVSIPQAIALGRALDRLPQRLLVFGVEGQMFSCGTAVSAPVRKAGGRVIEEILAAVARCRSPWAVARGDC